MNRPSKGKETPRHCDADTWRHADCGSCVVRQRMLFAGVDLDAATHLLQSVVHSWHQAGAALYLLGDNPQYVYSIRRGVVKLSLMTADGELRSVRLAGPGTTIGLEALTQTRYQHTAEALTPADICRIPVRSVNQLAIEQPLLCKQLMTQWQEQLAQADTHLLELATGQLAERVRKLLLMIDALCKKGGTAFVLPSNPDCAALVSARVESVSRVMAELKRSGFLHRENGGGWTPA
ncbi:Crp/Fnr family transcriptional regulator [Haliea sp. E17]|uniref:Crp/Fnr family transcriptional regulator n=1 Tax=Haliea sp. E17 TaxID=3401576 RepID=UPI003AAF4A88